MVAELKSLINNFNTSFDRRQLTFGHFESHVTPNLDCLPCNSKRKCLTEGERDMQTSNIQALGNSRERTCLVLVIFLSVNLLKITIQLQYILIRIAN